MWSGLNCHRSARNGDRSWRQRLVHVWHTEPRRLCRWQSSCVRRYVERYTGVNVSEDLTGSIFSLLSLLGLLWRWREQATSVYMVQVGACSSPVLVLMTKAGLLIIKEQKTLCCVWKGVLLLLNDISYNFKGCADNCLRWYRRKATWGILSEGGTTFSCASLYNMPEDLSLLRHAARSFKISHLGK